MALPPVLEWINTVLLAFFGVAGWRMVDEWRKSHDEKHAAELAGCRNEVAACNHLLKSVEERQQLQLQSRDDQIARLKDDNERLSKKRDERTELLEEQINFLKSQAPSGVAANFDALKKLHAQQVAGQDEKLEECQAALVREQREHQALLGIRDARIQELEAIIATHTTSACSEIALQGITQPNSVQRTRLEDDRSAVRVLAATQGSLRPLIHALGHWDATVREIAAKALVSRGDEAVSDLIRELEDTPARNALWWIVGRLYRRRMQQFVEIVRILAAMEDPVRPRVNELLTRLAQRRHFRAKVALRCINGS